MNIFAKILYMTTEAPALTANSTRSLISILALSEIMPLSKNLKAFLSQKIHQINIKKGELFCQEGDFCDRIYFLKKGVARGYLIKENSEITTWLCLEKEFILCFESYFKNNVSIENFQAMEDCLLDYIEMEDLRYCLQKFPEMETLYRYFLEKYFMASHNREMIFRISNASERFDYFRKNSNASMIERVPSKYIASYLGMRPETYCRIAKGFNKKNHKKY